jgi:hypothetical protein
MTDPIPARLDVASLASVATMVLTLGCANPEAMQARAVVTQDGECGETELSAELQRETSVTREWRVGCDFAFQVVHCNADGCHKAPPRPPCVEGLPCFEEDPETLRWMPPKSAAASGAP